MIKRQLLAFFISMSLILAPFRQAQAFVPAAYLAGYIITSSGAAYRIGQAGLAIGALAALLLSGDSSSTGTRGRIGLKDGLEPTPRQQNVSQSGTVRTVSGPPTDYEGGCVFSYSGTRVDTGDLYSFSPSTCTQCSERWATMKGLVDNPTNLKNTRGEVSQCVASGGIRNQHTYKYDSNVTVNYSSVDGGYGYVPAPRTTSDNFADVKINKDTQTGKIQFLPLKDDPDFQTQIDGSNTHPALSPDNGTVTMYGKAPDGNQRSLAVVNNGDGTVGVIEVTNNNDGSTVSIGQTNVDYSTGSITSATTQTQTGRVQVPETQKVDTTPQPAPAPTTTTTTTTTGTATVNVTVQFPSDYARQYEAQTAADSINAKLDQVFTPTTSPPLDPEAPTFKFFGTTFNNLLAFTLPSHLSQCPTGSFDWNGTHTIDVHCGLINDHKAELNMAMILMWSLLAFGIVLRS